jgi:hypothetical protein
MSFQTSNRSGEILAFPSLRAAYDHAKQDRDVWKISFTLCTNERVRLVRTPDSDQFVLSLLTSEMVEELRERGEHVLADLIEKT